MESPQNALLRIDDSAVVCEPPRVLARLPEPEPESNSHPFDSWTILTNRRWIILATLVAVVAFTAIDTWNQTPIYRANLKLQIDTEQANILPFKDYATSDFGYIPTEEYLKTQFEALSSRTLATRVINSLKLDKDPRFSGPRAPTSPIAKAMAWGQQKVFAFHPVQREARASVAAAPADEQRFSPHAAAFVSNVTVTPVKDSRVVTVSYDSPDPALAAEVLNALASEYIQMNFETKYDATITASKFLAKQLVDLKAQVEKSEAEMVKFAQEHNIYTLGEKENVIMQTLADLNAALTQAKAERIEKETTWRIVHSGQFPDSLRGDDIRKLEANVGQLQQQHARLRAFYKPGWPELKQTAGELTEAERQLAAAKAAALGNVETAYSAAQQREKLLAEALEAQKSRANELNKDSIQYSILKREVDSSKQIYDGMLQRMKEAGISAGLKSNNIHVVDPAEAPQGPYLPNTTANLIKALAGGLVLGIGLGFFVEQVSAYRDRSLKTPDDVDRFIRLPFLGLIPAVNTNLRAHGWRLLSRAKPAPGSDPGGVAIGEPVALVTQNSPKSIISEAYRDLRTSVLLSSSADRGPKVILVTSSVKGEGKTTTSVNLAITLAQADVKVLLMDCDMRNPSIHRILHVPNTNGISSYLAGTSTDSIPLTDIQISKIPNMFVYTAGRTPPNPSELIGSVRMKECLVALASYFDYIVVDSPPVLAVTDARILATMVDGVLLVIKGGATTKEAVGRSKRLLRDVNSRILGTLLNNVNFRARGSYYYSKYYYDNGQRESDSNDDERAENHAESNSIESAELS
jgi:polysaccharide biosynthesis transport protein